MTRNCWKMSVLAVFQTIKFKVKKHFKSSLTLNFNFKRYWFVSFCIVLFLTECLCHTDLLSDEQAYLTSNSMLSVCWFASGIKPGKERNCFKSFLHLLWTCAVSGAQSAARRHHRALTAGGNRNIWQHLSTHQRHSWPLARNLTSSCSVLCTNLLASEKKKSTYLFWPSESLVRNPHRKIPWKKPWPSHSSRKGQDPDMGLRALPLFRPPVLDICQECDWTSGTGSIAKATAHTRISCQSSKWQTAEAMLY